MNCINELHEKYVFVPIDKAAIICISKNNVDNIAFSKSTLKTSPKDLIQNCYFMVGNSLLRQKIDIPMGIDPAPFWANFLCMYENEYLSELTSNDKVKACHFHTTKHFIDDFGTLRMRVILRFLQRNLLEHSGIHVTFSNLDITVKDGVFSYKRFDKRDIFLFFIIRMPYIDSNIPKSIFYSALVGGFH